MMESFNKEVKVESPKQFADISSFDPEKRISPRTSDGDQLSDSKSMQEVAEKTGTAQYDPDVRVDIEEAVDKTTVEKKEDYPPNTSIVQDGKILYTDDHGEVYRIDDDLKPDHTYEINGYKYETDDKGRIVSAEGQLRLKDREGRLSIADSSECIGKGDQKKTDDRGHLIADMFDGSNGMENMTPQDAKLNQGEYKAMEQQLAKEVGDGKRVEYKVEPVYESDSRRPDAYVVTYSIDGEKSVRVFRNGGDN